MKVSFIKVDGIEYMAQYDKENVFFARKGNDKQRKMVVIELAYGETRGVYIIKGNEKYGIEVTEDTRFNADAHSLVRRYAPIIERIDL